MPSIGNDIVDLTLVENQGKSRDRRFIGRVFTSAEAEAIKKAPQPDYLLWSLWACKEAAYKAAMKVKPLPFSPRQFSLRTPSLDYLGANYRGWMETPVGAFHVNVYRTRHFVHALACSPDGPEEKVISKIWALKAEDESDALRRAVLDYLRSLFNCRRDELEIRRPKTEKGLGPPALFFKGERVEGDLTLSHDGKWGAFASVLDISR